MSNKRVGVIGGGQLAWMMSGAAKALGIDLIVQTPKPDDPAVGIAKKVIFASVDDGKATEQLAMLSDVITFENEFIDLEALQKLEQQGVCFRPSLTTLAPLLDKYHQRAYLKNIGIPVPDFMALEGKGQNWEWGFPVVLKARRHGYDGQGTFIIQTPEELETVCKRLKGVPLLLEAFVPFERELAVIAARNVTGEVVIYPVVETQQENQVCRRVFVPAQITPEISLQVNAIAHQLLESLQAVGVFGIELFLTSEGQVLVNEIAPRTHNSGHYTLDACVISQFEMLLRAVTGLSLEDTPLNCSSAVMVNLLGYEESEQDYAEKRAALAAIPNAHLHWYGKRQSRRGRKLGHITVLNHSNTSFSSDKPKTLKEIAQAIESLWYPANAGQ